ncbi:hypothetical protein KEJ45_06130 [Candidatus Bathyarchaeota archaeon]|nr:hypothetical protein [Candidatus Bathyarchaeota archaeon]
MEKANYPGKKVCGPQEIRETVKCLCEKGAKNSVVTPYRVEKECRKLGLKIDHNQAEACLEALEAENYGQLCQGEVPNHDERSGWELVRLAGPGKKWLIDPQKTSFDWWIIGFIIFSFVLNILAWQLKNRKDSEITHARSTHIWFIAGQIITH